MAQTGKTPQPARINGQIIIDQLIRNMELGRFEMGYSVLTPCIFSVYLHPDDYRRLAGIQELIKEDAARALAARMAQWNSKPTLFKRGKPNKVFRIARHEWWIEFFADSEDVVPAGDVEIHSELNDVPQPGYRGVKTSLIDRETSITESRVARDRTAGAFPTRGSGAAPANPKLAQGQHAADLAHVRP